MGAETVQKKKSARCFVSCFFIALSVGLPGGGGGGHSKVGPGKRQWTQTLTEILSIFFREN